MFTLTVSGTLFPFRKTAIVVLAGSLLAFQATNIGVAIASDSMAMPKANSKAAAVETFTVGEPGKSAKVDRTVEIKMKDVSFEPASVHVRLNETIRFVVTNTSEADHEFVLGDLKSQIAHRKEMVEMVDKGQDMQADHDPNAVAVKAGKTGELIWKFTRAGSFEFDCDVPGHFESGMTGALLIEAKK